MHDHRYLSQEPPNVEDGMSIPAVLPRNLRNVGSPPLTEPSPQYPVYSTVDSPYATYEMSPFSSSTLSTPGGSPMMSEDLPDLQSLKLEPDTPPQQPLPAFSRPEWQCGNSGVYHNQPHSPAASQHLHVMIAYDGLETTDAPEVHRPIAHPAHVGGYWPSPVLATEGIPYPMSMADVPPSALVRHDMALGQNMHSFHHYHHHQQPQNYHQAHATHDHQHYHNLDPSMRGTSHPYPSYDYAQSSITVNVDMDSENDRSASRSPEHQSSPTARNAARPARTRRTTRRGPRRGRSVLNRDELYPKEPEKRLRFGDNIKHQDQALYHMRCDCSGTYGSHMWDDIVAMYANEFQYKRTPTLQMQLLRAVQKHLGTSGASSDEQTIDV